MKGPALGVIVRWNIRNSSGMVVVWVFHDFVPFDQN